ncbi:hypothetical protein BZM27_54245, partial [Paraburkholderia steynii]
SRSRRRSAQLIDRAKRFKKKYRIISPYLFPTQKGGAYSKTGLHSMWRRAKERASVTDGIQFTGSARAGRNGRGKGR